MEEKPQPLSDVPSGATADRAAKHDLQDENTRGIPKRYLFKLDELSEIMKTEARCSEEFKKLAKQDPTAYKNKQNGCSVKTKKMD